MASVSTGIIQPILPLLDQSNSPFSPSFSLLTRLREQPAHVATESLIIEQSLDAADGRNSDVLIPDPPLCKADDVVGGDSVDGSLDLAGAHPSAGGHDLSANVLSQGGGAVQGQQNRGLELGLGALDLSFGNGLGEARPLAHDEVHEVVDAGELVGHEGDAPETIKGLVHVDWVKRLWAQSLPSVAVACGEAHEAVGQVVLVDEAAELAALVRRVAQNLVVVADDSLSDQSSEVVIVVPANALHRNGDVGGGNGVVTYPDIRANELGLLLGEEVGVGLDRKSVV